MSKKTITLTQKIKCHEILKGVLRRVGDGFDYVNSEYSDATVAAAISTAENPAGANNVQSIRLEMFGKFPAKFGSVDGTAALAELAALVHSLSARVAKLESSQL